MSIQYALASLFLPAILLSGVSLVAAEADSIPGDFRVCARYGPGFSDWKPWKVTIFADGKALQEVYPSRLGKEATTEKTEKTTTLTVPQLQELVAAHSHLTIFRIEGAILLPRHG